MISTATGCFARASAVAIQLLLMDRSSLIDGVNLTSTPRKSARFRAAGISPLRAANRISRQRYQVLAVAIRATLADSIAAGGSSVRDYVLQRRRRWRLPAFLRGLWPRGQPPSCQQPVRARRQAGRSTFCPRCQRWMLRRRQHSSAIGPFVANASIRQASADPARLAPTSGGRCHKPCLSEQPKSSNDLAWAMVSTPSAITVRSKAAAGRSNQSPCRPHRSSYC